MPAANNPNFLHTTPYKLDANFADTYLKSFLFFEYVLYTCRLQLC